MKLKSIHFGVSAALMGIVVCTGFSRADDAPATRPTAPGTQPSAEGPRHLKAGEFMTQLEKLVNGLNLTSEQKPKTEALFQKAKDDLKSAREQTPDRKVLTQKVKTIFDGVRDGLKSILTDEQQQALQKQLPNNQGAAGGPVQMLQRLQGSLEQLGLSDDQKKQVDEVLKDARDQFAKIREEAQKGGAADAARDKILAAVQDTRKKLEDVLTPEQKQKLRELRKPAGDRRGPGEGAGGANGPGPL